MKYADSTLAVGDLVLLKKPALDWRTEKEPYLYAIVTTLNIDNRHCNVRAMDGRTYYFMRNDKLILLAKANKC